MYLSICIVCHYIYFFFFKQKTAYEMRISDWSSDVCSSDLVLTEVYGYARARRVIWTGFAALAFMAFMAWVVVSLPPAEGWPGQPAYEFVFGNSWRIVIASMTAFWAGEFANSYVLARMKIWTGGRHLWMRTIG